MSKQYEDSELQKDPPCSMLENNEEDLASEASENQKPKGVTRRKFAALVVRCWLLQRLVRAASWHLRVKTASMWHFPFQVAISSWIA